MRLRLRYLEHCVNSNETIDPTIRARLHWMSVSMQCERCYDASETALIKNKEVIPKWVHFEVIQIASL